MNGQSYIYVYRFHSEKISKPKHHHMFWFQTVNKSVIRCYYGNEVGLILCGFGFSNFEAGVGRAQI